MTNALIFANTKERCLAACLNENRFICRSVEYNYASLRCSLSEVDRRSFGKDIQFIDAPGVDYFENFCMKPKEACKANRIFAPPKIGVKDDKIAQYAGIHYYSDKEMIVPNESMCKSACELENDVLCRSYLYRGAPKGNSPNCHLFHMDHWLLPDGPSTYLNAERPLIDDGKRIGVYYENHCESKCINSKESSILFQFNFILIIVIFCFSEGAPELPIYFDTLEDIRLLEKNSSKSTTDINCDKTGTCYDGKNYEKKKKNL